jgi:transposase
MKCLWRRDCLLPVPGRPAGPWPTVPMPAPPSAPGCAPRAAIPPFPAKRGEKTADRCPDWLYNNRNLVERLWGRLKEWRAVATRYEKTAASFHAVLCLAAVHHWIRG